MISKTSHRNQDIIQKEIDTKLDELVQLRENGFYSIAKISWWLLKSELVYTHGKATWNNNSAYGDLPCSHTLKSLQNKFCDLYEGLDKVTKLHKYEVYLKKSLLNIDYIQNNPTLLNDWLLKHENLGTNYLFEFWTEWYEKEKNYVQPFILNWQHLDIKFKIEEWKNTISFLHYFDKYYWDSDFLKIDK